MEYTIEELFTELNNNEYVSLFYKELEVNEILDGKKVFSETVDCLNKTEIDFFYSSRLNKLTYHTTFYKNVSLISHD